MKRILFVDDEPRILEGLQRILRPRRGEWDMNFADSGQAALVAMETASYDVVVTDMKMPKMDGATLLKIVRERYPCVLRIVLSGYTDIEASYRAVPVAHQFLLKPCEPDKLHSAIDRGTCLIDLLNHKGLAGMIGSLRDLPSAPEAILGLKVELESPEPSLRRIVSIIERDVAIAAKVLQMVNSAFFGNPREVTDIETAVTLIGANTLRHLVLSVEAFRSFTLKKKVSGFALEEFDEHAQLTSRIAAGIAEQEELPTAMAIAALLHDVGKLVLAECTPEQFSRAWEEANGAHEPLHVVEERNSGVGHAEVGAYLLGLWGLPYPVIEAVAHHHRPRRAKPQKFDMVVGVYVANVLARQVAPAPSGFHASEILEVDTNLLESFHVEGKVAAWKKMAEEQTCKQQKAKA